MAGQSPADALRLVPALQVLLAEPRHLEPLRHYATCSQRPKQLTDLEDLIYFQASVRLDELLLDTGCKDWVDKLYDQMPPFQLRCTISASLSLVKAYFKQLEFLLFSRKQKKQAAREDIKLKQLEIGHFFQPKKGSKPIGK